MDLVVMGARGETELVYPGYGGGTLERVVKSLSTSVVVVPRVVEPTRGILLGYDGSAGAVRALRAVRHLLQLVEAPVHAVCVGEAATNGDPLDDVERGLGDLSVPVHRHRTTGIPREVLPALAHSLDCNLIAIGYRGRSLVRDIFLGRSTEWLLRYVDCALLVAR
jgi:nucleotide-binding universal stress UspA family protein